jgi:predicted ThiF/HesA family dinucleotide-utilizing enzyme
MRCSASIFTNNYLAVAHNRALRLAVSNKEAEIEDIHRRFEARSAELERNFTTELERVKTALDKEVAAANAAREEARMLRGDLSAAQAAVGDAKAVARERAALREKVEGLTEEVRSLTARAAAADAALKAERDEASKAKRTAKEAEARWV